MVVVGGGKQLVKIDDLNSIGGLPSCVCNGTDHDDDADCIVREVEFPKEEPNSIQIGGIQLEINPHGCRDKEIFGVFSSE